MQHVKSAKYLSEIPGEHKALRCAMLEEFLLHWDDPFRLPTEQTSYWEQGKHILTGFSMEDLLDRRLKVGKHTLIHLFLCTTFVPEVTLLCDYYLP